MTDQTETVTVDDLEADWISMIGKSPAMGRLPQMVADSYSKDFFKGPSSFEEMQLEVKESVRLGLVLLFRLFGESFLNRMFEHFSHRFGQAVEIFMEDIQLVVNDNLELADGYTLQEIAGRFFALLAMLIDSHQLPEDEALLLERKTCDRTGFNLDMNPLSVLMVMEHVIACAELEPKTQAIFYGEGRAIVLGYAFLLKEKTPQTRCH